jgi:hypothetical protein
MTSDRLDDHSSLRRPVTGMAIWYASRTLWALGMIDHCALIIEQ